MKHKALVIAITLISVVLLTGFTFALQRAGMIFEEPFPLIWHYGNIQNGYMRLDLQGSPEYVLGNMVTRSQDTNSKSNIYIRAIGPDLREGGVYLQGDGNNSSATLTTGTANVTVHDNYVEIFPMVQSNIVQANTGFTIGNNTGYNGDVNINDVIIHIRGGIIIDVTSSQAESFTK